MESLELLKVYMDYVMLRTRVFLWHKSFTEGREEVEDTNIWVTLSHQKPHSQEQKDTQKDICFHVMENQIKEQLDLLKMSSHVTKCAFFSTIQKRRDNQCTGRLPHRTE